MPSMLHEVLVELFRNAPELLVDLLRGRLDVLGGRDVRFERDERNLSQLPDLDADLVLRVLDASGRLCCALILEIQLERDREKERAWPAYQAGIHRRLGCPTFVMVIAIKPRVARWAAGPFCTGQTHFRPLVIGPQHLPIVSDRGHAHDNVELALLSGLAHRNDPEVEQIGEVLWHALNQQPSRHHDLYWDLFLGAVGEATRRHLMMRFENYKPQSEWGQRYYSEGKLEGEREGRLAGEREGRLAGEREGRLEGKREGRLAGRLEGEAAALTALLQARGLSPGPELHERIAQCRDPNILREWLLRAATATDLGEVFGPE